MFFFFNDTATTEIYTLSLHDALPIYARAGAERARAAGGQRTVKTRTHSHARSLASLKLLALATLALALFAHASADACRAQSQTQTQTQAQTQSAARPADAGVAVGEGRARERGSGSITGRVVGESGEALPGALVYVNLRGATPQLGRAQRVATRSEEHTSELQ